MKNSTVLLLSLVGAAVAQCALLQGCNSTDNGAGGGGNDGGQDASTALQGSGAGESCTRTADCETGLVCIQNTCYPGQGTTGDGGADATIDVVEEEGGAQGTGPRLGEIGAACQKATDCASNLECVAATGGVGICSLVNYGLTPTGKACTGECTQASDCCELPLNVYLYTCSGGSCFNYVAIHTCDDVLQLVLGGDKTVCTSGRDAGSAVAAGCFYYQTYCQCPQNTWACTKNTCVYSAACSTSTANQPGGCPSLSRTRAQLPTTCNPTTNKCQASTGGCSSASDCNDAGVADLLATCLNNDCTCYQSGCYIKCSKDLDCQAGYSCDSTTSLCVQGSCTNDQECASQLGNVRAKCQSGACKVVCANDHDCSPAGGPGQGNFNGTVCDPSSKFCVPLGCTADIDCASSGNVRTFCVPASDAGAVSVHSAITN